MSASKKSRPAGFYTPHNDYELSIKQSKTNDAVAIADQLASKMQSRGTEFGIEVGINLRKLAEDFAPLDLGDGSLPPPKIKPTVLRYVAVARAAVTAHLEITKGGHERTVGWLEVGDEIQARSIGETVTGRQRVLDSKAWWVKGVPGEGWISAYSVTGKQLLKPLLPQRMPNETIRMEPERWEGSAMRQALEIEYDPTFLPPAPRRLPSKHPKSVTTSHHVGGPPGKLAPPVQELQPTSSFVTNQAQDGWRLDRLNDATSATVRHLFSDVGLQAERKKRDADEEILAWRPPPDVPHVVSSHRANPGRVYGRLNHSEYYRGPNSSWLDPDYLAFIKRRYPEQDLNANLTAERTGERYPGQQGVEQRPWEAQQSAAVQPGSKRREQEPKYSGNPADRLDARAIGSKVLHGLTGPPSDAQLTAYLAVRNHSARELELRRNPPQPVTPVVPPPSPIAVATSEGSMLVLPSKIVALGGTEKAVEDQVGGAWALTPMAGVGQGAKNLLNRGGPRLYGGDMKRYSKVYERALRATDRKTIRHSGALAAQRSAMFKGGGYFESRNKVVEATASAAELHRPCRADWADTDLALAHAAAPEAWEHLTRGHAEIGNKEIGAILDKVPSSDASDTIQNYGKDLSLPIPFSSPRALSDITERMSEYSAWTDGLPSSRPPSSPAYYDLNGPLSSRPKTPQLLDIQADAYDDADVFDNAVIWEGGDGNVSSAASLQPPNLSSWKIPPSIPELGSALSWRQRRSGTSSDHEGTTTGSTATGAVAEEVESRERRLVCSQQGGSDSTHSSRSAMEDGPKDIGELRALIDTHSAQQSRTDANFRQNMIVAELKSQNMHGPALRRHQRWMVQVRAEHDRSKEAASAAFEVAVQAHSGWTTGHKFKVLREVSVRAKVDLCDDPHSQVIGTLQPGTIHTVLGVRHSPCDAACPGQPRLQVQIRHRITGWFSAATKNGTVLVVRLGPDELNGKSSPRLPMKHRPPVFTTRDGRLAATDAHAPSKRNETRIVPELQIADEDKFEVESIKQILRAAATSSRDRTWAAMLGRFDRSQSGLLSCREFKRCIRRYVAVSQLPDDALERFSEAVDKDGSGEISVAEFEQFLNTGSDMCREIAAATRIQSVRRGRLVRAQLQYERSVVQLQRKADSQCDLIKRRLRSLAYENGGTNWRSLFVDFDRDGSGMLQFDEFRRACRTAVNQHKVTDRELGILFKRMDTDGSGEIDINEFETFLNSGDSAELELRSAVQIQSRVRGRNSRRECAIYGVEQRWVDVGAPRKVGQDTSLWKWEKLTEPYGKNAALWPSVCQALNKRLLGDNGKCIVGTVCIICSTSERAEWLAKRLVDRQKCVVDLVTSNMSSSERFKVANRWHEVDHRKTVDDRGRRPVLVCSDLSSEDWSALRLWKLNLQLLINFDMPKSCGCFLARLSCLRRWERSKHARGWAITLCEGADEDQEGGKLQTITSLIGYRSPRTLEVAGLDLADRIKEFCDETLAERTARHAAAMMAVQVPKKRASDEWPKKALELSEKFESEGEQAARRHSFRTSLEHYRQALLSLRWGNEEHVFKKGSQAVLAAVRMGGSSSDVNKNE